MKAMGTRHGIMEVLNKCYFEPVQGCTGFVLCKNPVHLRSRISASLSSEFHPETKMKNAQPGKAVDLTHAQGLIHFRKIPCIRTYFLPFLWKQGIFLKTPEWSSLLTPSEAFKDPPESSPGLCFHFLCVFGGSSDVQSYLLIASYWFHQGHRIVAALWSGLQ